MAETNPIGDKTYIRKQMAMKRNGLRAEQRKIASAAACTNAQMLFESRSVDSFMVYIAFRSELDLSELIEWGWRTGREVIVPKCIAADRSMILYYLRSWDELTPGAYGIMEPNPEAATKVEAGAAPGAIIVPGLAFDRNGGRLGYGGGYYDRFAEQMQGYAAGNGHRLWLGASFEEQLIDEVPLERHDLVMDGVITEQAVYLHRRSDRSGTDAF
ncbi:5-formyltetrahydrofolate cyclo-ligase [Paenibacillus paridis]|uniref:5-formyltetrahydrofolate cyclo-ligase n=1 Tax=Paenibacillus paridis TaxID=2583376 RepID=UPI001EE48E91|nr:5-formyltetrahydrofolate cyclo-ligase [Paenibacillus paridis]